MRSQLRFIGSALTLGVAILVLGQPARATVLTARAEGQVLGSSQVDAQGPASSGALLATVRFPAAFRITFRDTSIAQAAMNDSGVGAVVADGVFPGHTGDFLRSEASWSQTVTNTHNQAYEYLLEFFITPPRLTIADGTPGTGGDPAFATYEVDIDLNDIRLFRSLGELSGTWAGHTLRETGIDLGGTPFTDPVHHVFGYAFSPYRGLLSLGSFGPGESFTVRELLIATSSSATAGRGGRAEVGDPLDLGGEPGLRNNFVLSIPIAVEPRTWSGVKSLYRP